MEYYTIEQAIRSFNDGNGIYIIPGEAFKGENEWQKKGWISDLGENIFNMWYDRPLRVLSFEDGLMATVIDSKYYDENKSPQILHDLYKNAESYGTIICDDRFPSWESRALEQFMKTDVWRLTNQRGVCEYAELHGIKLCDLN